jgi:flagellar biosynthesis regulator FlbT
MGNFFTKNKDNDFKCPKDYNQEDFLKIKSLYLKLNSNNASSQEIDAIVDCHFLNKIQLLENKKIIQKENHKKEIDNIQYKAELKLINDLTHANDVNKICISTINSEINEIKNLSSEEKKKELKKEISKYDHEINFNDFFKYMKGKIKYFPYD